MAAIGVALLAMAEAGPLDALQRARLELLRAQVAFHTTRGSEVSGMLLDAAKTLAPLDPALSRETYLQALQASFHAGRLGHGRGLLEAAEAARVAPALPMPPRPADLLLDGLATRFIQGYEASVPTLQRALETLRDHESRPGDDSDRCAREARARADETAGFRHRVRSEGPRGALCGVPPGSL